MFIKQIYCTAMLRFYCVVYETYIMQKTLLVEKICDSRIKRLIWGFRGNNRFFCSEIHLKRCLQLDFQKPSLYTRLVRSTIGYSVCIKHIKSIHHQLLLCALDFGCFCAARA